MFHKKKKNFPSQPAREAKAILGTKATVPSATKKYRLRLLARRKRAETGKAELAKPEKVEKKFDKKGNFLIRTLVTLVSLLLIAFFVPQILWGVTGLALVREAMLGEHKEIDRILEIVIGKKK